VSVAASGRAAVQDARDPRFRRATVRPVRPVRPRRRGRVWRIVAGLAGLGAMVALGWAGAAWLLGSPRFRIDRIVVRGNTRLSAGEVAALVGALRGQSLLRADLEAARARLLESPWLADASLRRVLPSSVEVTVVERMPMAIGRIGGRLFLVDADGVVIDEYGPQYAQVDLPVVDGLVPGGGTGPVDPERAALVRRLLAALAARPALQRKVSQVDVSDAHDAVVLLDDDAARLHLGDTRFVERLQTYLEVAPRLRERIAEIDAVDLRFDTRVYVRPGPVAGEAVPASRAR
jgi:cell division protein FtsQ